MNTVIYARYSSDNQREESIEGQLRECNEYAQQNGMTVIGTYIDRAFSAKTDDRPQFQQMIKDSNTHKFEIVLVWKLDRFSRNRFDSAYYKRALSKNKVRVVSATEPISNTPEGIMLESLLEGMAEYYSAELAEKVTRGHKENALKAKFNGGVIPLGYVIDKDRHYQLDPLTAPIVHEVFQKYADGEQIKALCEMLNARGLRTGKGCEFTKSSFHRLLQNRRYLGEYRYKDIVLPGAIPAIVDPETFERVQRRSAQNKQAHSRTKADEVFILTTKVFCGECGAMIAGESGKSHTGTMHYYYKCGTAKRKGSCKCRLKPIRKNILEKYVVKTAVQYVLRDDVIEEIAKRVLEFTSQENTRLPVLRTELRDVNKRIANLVSAIEQGIVSPTTKQRLDALEEQRASLEVSILQEEISKPTLTREQIVYWFEQFKKSDIEDQAICKQIVDSFVNSVYISEKRLVLVFNYKEGDRLVSFFEVTGSSDTCDGAPKENHQTKVWWFSFGISTPKM